MAGIPLYFVDLQDDLDDFGFEDYGPDCESMRITAFLDIPGQDNLTPLARLEKYAFSDNIFNRQIIARGLLDVLRDFSSNEEDFLTVMEIVVRLSEDTEPTVRTELIEQIPQITIFLQESRPHFPRAFSEYLMPILVRYLTDPNNQVRKVSQEALLILLEQDLIDQSDLENKVCPILLDLSAPENDDEYKVEAVNIICKMISMLGKQTVEQMLLPRFCDLCSDSKLFQVRKVCAANFGDVCNAVGQEATEKFLIPKFLELCSDSAWGMRKVCAECFMSVSYTTSSEVRRTKLSPLFITLISDPCRWVRQTAFQSLGPFISTFANPSSAGLYVKEDGTLSIRSPADDANHFYSRISNDKMNTTLTSDMSCNASSNCKVQKCPVECTGETRTIVSLEATSSHCKKAHGSHVTDEPRPTDLFNSFLYWRSPLPDISEELELLPVEQSNADSKRELKAVSVCNTYMASSDIQMVIQSLQGHLDDPDVQAQVQVLSAALRAAELDSDSQDEMPSTQDDSTSPQEEYCPECPAEPLSLSQSTGSLYEPEQEDQSTDSFSEDKAKVQDVVPQPLLDQYLSMTDPVRAQTVDTEITKHCAYSLPGVALTLGRQNWHCLKDTYETLAADVQWKVRRTLAFSIHELAVILGDQLTAADLVPIFNAFLKDLDEVRIGVLKHLYDFLKLLHSDMRREYLYQLQEFLTTENIRNWRFRYELAEQLILILELYNPKDVYDYLRIIALTLCSDKISEVRWISFKLVVAILHKLYSNGENQLGINFINELILQFRHSPKWVGRQAFAFICQAVVQEECIPADQFASHLLPNLLSLASDPVPNVRVLLAKALKQTLLEKAYFTSLGNPYLDAVEKTVLTMQLDRDQDVRFFSSTEPKRHITSSPTEQSVD
ncbi:serine threonine- phosphatase 4 regulatory subunit 1-like isoform X1 [Pelobates cultripes]|uniref:Serine threonine- phosphatase 4 regulatory subunit 1-like isoform X1 n=3 Tax=Pelobates cultripes TaxID=61616 RepID=A0AAD1SKD0_PELCU|nr:serine threonine- phosphatase 4 regulatory subunit 1-like isoform X1 [Pelobates cultripes]CAH2303235.1 serine threonine- phosphatase 4 regulatory subunit 1-like isoform X1 [Pelobates cultripes]